MLAIGNLLQNRYRIVRRIGQGGMGAVYEARHEDLDHTVALKETFHTEDASLRRAFKREARILAGLRHPSLPRVTDYFTEDDGLYLVMEHIPGNDLMELLSQRKEPFSVAEVWRWTDQLLDVLEYLHGQDPPVIHRDIKPNNIKLNEEGDIILLDFGLAKGAMGEATSVIASRSVLGFTLTYAPLEQILKADPNLLEHLSVFGADRIERILQTGTDARSDLYSLGATAYHLLTKKQPAQSPTRAVAIWSGRMDPLLPVGNLNPRVPAEFSAALLHAMALASDDRPANAAEMRRLIGEATASPTAISHPSELAVTLASPTLTNVDARLTTVLDTNDDGAPKLEQMQVGDPTQKILEPQTTIRAEIPFFRNDLPKPGQQIERATNNGWISNPRTYIPAAVVLVFLLWWLFNAFRTSPSNPTNTVAVSAANNFASINSNRRLTTNANTTSSVSRNANLELRETKPLPSNSSVRRITGLMDLSDRNAKYERLVSIESEPVVDSPKDYTYHKEGNNLYVVVRNATLSTAATSMDGSGGAYYNAELQQSGSDVVLLVKLKEGTRTWVWRNNSIIIQVDYVKNGSKN